MNNNIILALLLTACLPINAYECSFYNGTQEPIGIAIQFAGGENEPLYKQFIKPGAMKSFTPGSLDIPDIKWSFCLQNVYYVKNPTIEQRADYFAKTSWRKISITWTPSLLKSEKKTKRLPRKKMPINQSNHILVKKAHVKPEDKSLCRDRHFEVIEDKNGAVLVMGSLKG